MKGCCLWLTARGQRLPLFFSQRQLLTSTSHTSTENQRQSGLEMKSVTTGEMGKAFSIHWNMKYNHLSSIKVAQATHCSMTCVNTWKSDVTTSFWLGGFVLSCFVLLCHFVLSCWGSVLVTSCRRDTIPQTDRSEEGFIWSQSFSAGWADWNADAAEWEGLAQRKAACIMVSRAAERRKKPQQEMRLPSHTSSDRPLPDRAAS